MNKALFLSLSVSALAVVTFFAAPAQAQYAAQNTGNPVATGYCTGETVQISGWERDLVRKNKGLEKFHCSAINTVQHYQVVPTVANKRGEAKPLTPYHNVKPQVVSNWSNPKGPAVDRTCIASVDNYHANPVAQPRSYGNGGNTSTYAQLNRNDNNSYNYQQVSGYGSERSSDRRVSARVMLLGH